MAPIDVAFAGSIPEYYDLGLGPVMFEPYAIETANRLRDLQSGSVLELACGTGRVTRQLRSVLPESVRLVATDLSESMLSYAQENSPGEISWQLADVQDLPFGDHKFDAVVCQFCLMFVPDKELAVREIRRVLKPGGKALVFVWDRVETVEIVNANRQLLHDYFPVDTPGFMNIPFSMFNPEENRDLFRTAFENVDVERIAHTSPIDDPELAAKGCILGNPVAGQIAERDPEAPPELIRRLTEILKANPKSDLSALLITAS